MRISAHERMLWALEFEGGFVAKAGVDRGEDKLKEKIHNEDIEDCSSFEVNIQELFVWLFSLKNLNG